MTSKGHDVIFKKHGAKCNLGFKGTPFYNPRNCYTTFWGSWSVRVLRSFNIRKIEIKSTEVWVVCSRCHCVTYRVKDDWEIPIAFVPVAHGGSGPVEQTRSTIHAHPGQQRRNLSLRIWFVHECQHVILSFLGMECKRWKISTCVGAQKKAPKSPQTTVFSLYIFMWDLGTRGGLFSGDQRKWKINSKRKVNMEYRKMHGFRVRRAAMVGRELIDKTSPFISCNHLDLYIYIYEIFHIICMYIYYIYYIYL